MTPPTAPSSASSTEPTVSSRPSSRASISRPRDVLLAVHHFLYVSRLTLLSRHRSQAAGHEVHADRKVPIPHPSARSKRPSLLPVDGRQRQGMPEREFWSTCADIGLLGTHALYLHSHRRRSLPSVVGNLHPARRSIPILFGPREPVLHPAELAAKGRDHRHYRRLPHPRSWRSGSQRHGHSGR